MPIYDCAICNQTHFRKDVIQRHLNNSTKNRYICKKCKKSLDHDKTIKFAVPEQIRRNKRILIVKELYELEERLIALRLPFLQI